MFKVLVAFFSFLSIAKVSSQELFDAFEPSMHLTDSSVSDIIDDSITVVQYYDVTGNPVSYVEYYPNGKMRTYFSATKGMAKENFDLNCVKWDGDELIYYAVTGPGTHFFTYEIDSMYNITYRNIDMIGAGTETVYDSRNRLIRSSTFFNSDWRTIEYYPSGNIHRVYQRWKGFYYGAYCEFNLNGQLTINGSYIDLSSLTNGNFDNLNSDSYKNGTWLFYENGALLYTEIWQNNKLVSTTAK